MRNFDKYNLNFRENAGKEQNMALTHKERLVKVIYERLGEKMGARLADSGFGRMLGGLGNISPGLQETIGIGAATMVQSPRIFGNVIARLTGGNPDRISSNLNEGLDEGLRTFLGTIADNQQKNPNYVPNESEFETAANDIVKKMLAGHPADFSLPADRTVVVDVQQHVFHDEHCPACWRATTTGGKKGEARTEKTVYQPGFRPNTLKWALENGYVPTSGTCCGTSTANLIGQLRKTPEPMGTVVQYLSQSMKDRYYLILDAADDSQRRTIQAAGALSEWTVDRLTDILERSTSVPSFIRKLPKPPVKLAPLEQVSKFFDGLKGSDQHLDTIRTHVDDFTNKTNEANRAQRRRINKLKAAFRR